MNSSKDINLFLPQTEYHFLQSLNIASSNYSDRDCINEIHIMKIKGRINIIEPESDLYNIKVIIHESKSYVTLIKELISINCKNFFFFQENSILNRFLAYKLRSKYKTQINLAPDGYKPYAIYNKKHEFLSLVKDSITDNLFLLKNKLETSKVFISENYRYGSSSFIDAIWLQYPAIFNKKVNKTKAELKTISDLTKESMRLFERYFTYDYKIPKNKGIILYLNQPFWTEKLIEKEIEFLKEMKVIFDETIYIKLHPSTPKETIERYITLEGIEILNLKLPSEFLIPKLNKCIIFSGWSSALITANPSCNFYFNYPIYKNCTAKAVDQSTLLILPHIKTVVKPTEMKFPNE